MVSAAAGVVDGLVGLLARRVRVCGLAEAEEALVALREQERGRRVLYYHWIEDVLPRLVLARRVGWHLGADVGFVCDDTFFGQVGARIVTSMGGRPMLFRASQGVVGINDLRALLREPAPINIAADGRGPYGRVHPGLVGVVRGRGAVAIAVAVVARPYLGALGTKRFSVPLPGSALAIGVDKAAGLDGLDDRAAVRALEAGLRNARAIACQLLADA